MAYPFINSDPAAWDSLAEDRCALINKLSINRNNNAELRLAEIEDLLLDSAAPNFEALILKFELLWGHRFHEETREARQFCQIIGDVRRLAYSQQTNNRSEHG